VTQHWKRDAGCAKRIAERRRFGQIDRVTIQHNARHAGRISNGNAITTSSDICDTIVVNEILAGRIAGPHAPWLPFRPVLFRGAARKSAVAGGEFTRPLHFSARPVGTAFAI
jgi:hypothetical protein